LASGPARDEQLISLAQNLTHEQEPDPSKVLLRDGLSRLETRWELAAVGATDGTLESPWDRPTPTSRVTKQSRHADVVSHHGAAAVAQSRQGTTVELAVAEHVHDAVVSAESELDLGEPARIEALPANSRQYRVGRGAIASVGEAVEATSGRQMPELGGEGFGKARAVAGDSGGNRREW
jgi:hypothetical protein